MDIHQTESEGGSAATPKAHPNVIPDAKDDPRLLQVAGMLDLGLRDTHVLVTGANGGIGYETARLFLTQGARVTAHYHRSNSSLRPLVHHFSPLSVRTAQADLTEELAVQRLFDEADKTIFGPVQVLVINHGVWPDEDVPIFSMDLTRWRAIMDVNLTSSFLVVREFLKRLEARKARTGGTSIEGIDGFGERISVVFVGSTAGKYGEAGHADYAVSKSGLMYGLLLSLKNEIVKIAPRARANCVAPGWVYTPMAEKALNDPETVYEALATTPLRKIAIPSDVAHQIVILASPIVSGHVTGQVVMVEGGMEGRLLNRREQMLRVVKLEESMVE